MSATLFLRSAFWTVALPGVFAGIIPVYYFGFQLRDLAGITDAAGAALLAVGIFLVVTCIVEFARRGRGTLSPLDPPRRLVVSGLYRFVRNPMYVGVMCILAGQVIISESAALAVYAVAYFVSVNVFILMHEEPALERSFGAAYLEYKRHVPRWLPRRTPWVGMFVVALAGTIGGACATRQHAPALSSADAGATLAQIYFWRARPGKAEEYNRYIREVAEPIDAEAQRAGAFISVTTYEANDTTLPWTHMRVFLLRDSAQLSGLSAALSAAGARLQPDSAARRRQGEYSATLRDRVGAAVTRIVR